MTALVLIFATALAAQTPQEITGEPVDQLMTRVLVQDQRDRVVMRGLEFERRLTEDRLDENDQVIARKESTNMSGLDLSIRNVFRPGRYRYKYATVPNCHSIGVLFFPRPEDEQLAPGPGNGWKQVALNTVLNTLGGELCIDEGTGGIKNFRAYSTRPIGIKIGRVYRVKIEYGQVWRYDAWLPDRSISYVFFSPAFGLAKQRRRFTAVFDHYRPRPPLP